MNVMIVPGILVCSSFLITVCMFIALKVLLISSATVIVCTGVAIWLNPFATVFFFELEDLYYYDKSTKTLYKIFT